jgi:putative hemolysin
LSSICGVEQEKTIIQSAVDFDDMKVKQVMCPRENIFALDIDRQMTKDELIDYILDNPYTRIPVYKNSIDNILGILHTQKLLKHIMTKQSYNIEKLLVKPIFVRPNVHLDTLFDEFKKKRTHIAVVQDKEENTIGIVTMEDLLEELVGDIDESNEGGVSHD